MYLHSRNLVKIQEFFEKFGITIDEIEKNIAIISGKLATKSAKMSTIFFWISSIGVVREFRWRAAAGAGACCAAAGALVPGVMDSGGMACGRPLAS